MKKQDQSMTVGPASDKVAGRIATAILWLQKKWAVAMSAVFARLSPKSAKVLLIACGLFMLAYSSILIGYSFTTAGKLMQRPEAIRLPLTEKGLRLPDLKQGLAPAVLPIRKFEQYLDSLGQSEEGKRKRDSLLRTRPGLMDSIRTLDRILCP